MAKITLGMATSHSPMLSTPHEHFATHAVRDRQNPDVPNFEALAQEKASWIGRELAPTVTLARHEASQTALAILSRTLAEAEPDVVVVVGDDQGEWFSSDNQPALCIYWGESVDNLPPPLEQVPAPRRHSYWGFYGDGTNQTFPVDAQLGLYLIESLTHEYDFDVAHIRVQPRHSPFGHAWNFVHQRLMGDRIVPIVPVMLNTYYPPNQPTPRRCFQLGRAIRQVVEAWGPDKKVAVVGSGGLSHFVVDEELDRAVLDALEVGDANAIAQLPLEKLDSGNSEIRNWIAAAGAAEHLKMRLVDYLPSYRSEAGTGIGLGFAVWE